MDKVHRQHGSIVLYEEKKDGEQYIRIAYADNPVIAPMLSQEPGISLDGNGNAYIKASDFRLPIFHAVILLTPTLIIAGCTQDSPNPNGNTPSRNSILMKTQ